MERGSTYGVRLSAYPIVKDGNISAYNVLNDAQGPAANSFRALLVEALQQNGSIYQRIFLKSAKLLNLDSYNMKLKIDFSVTSPSYDWLCMSKNQSSDYELSNNTK